MFLLYTSWRFPLSASQRRSEKRLSKQPQPLTSALHPLYTHSWKMALSLSRASLFCGFFGVVIFCLFTISSYVHVHLLRKFNKNQIVWKFLKKLVFFSYFFIFWNVSFLNGKTVWKMISWGNFLQVENGTLFNDNRNECFQWRKQWRKPLLHCFLH